MFTYPPPAFPPCAPRNRVRFETFNLWTTWIQNYPNAKVDKITSSFDHQQSQIFLYIWIQSRNNLIACNVAIAKSLRIWDLRFFLPSLFTLRIKYIHNGKINNVDYNFTQKQKNVLIADNAVKPSIWRINFETINLQTHT